MRASLVIAAVALVAAVANAKIYYSETFDDSWDKRWVVSTFKGAEAGKLDVSAGKYNSGNVKEDQGLHTAEDARFYQATSTFEEFSNEGKSLYLQYSVKHEQRIDCGGGYIKIHPKGIDQAKYNGDSPYNVMFGPDICGSSTRKVHVIFNYKGENHLINKNVPCETDEFSHVYTLALHPDNTYAVSIDGVEKQKGSLKEDWNMLPPKQIKDPKASKPADWVDERQIPDPSDVKPAGWDDIPAEIADPNAAKPEDWDDELDGEWEAPMIDNPAYKGEWKPKMIDNPAYKGEWVHPLVDNPDYKDDDNLYRYTSNAAVGFELWQVKAGTIFDNILITDDAETAKAWAEKTLALQAKEKEAKEADDKAAREREEEERKKREAEEKDKPAAKDDEDDLKDEL